MPTERIREFLHSIGIDTKPTALDENECFVPGLCIKDGSILIDEEKMTWPGDMIHEAGHLCCSAC